MQKLNPDRIKSLLTAFIVIVLANAVFIYFRMIPMPMFKSFLFSANPNQAETMVTQALRNQVAEIMSKKLSGMDKNAREKLIDMQVKSIVQSDPKYKETVQQMREGISANASQAASQRYLLESDPYYYYHLVQTIQKTGFISASFKDGKYYDPYSNAPKGKWLWMNLHPHLGYYWYRLLCLFNPSIDIVTALSSLPVFLSVLISLLFFFICTNLLQVGVLASFIGSISLLLSPIFLQRSCFGWFDTDPYNHLFPLIVLIFLLQANIKQKNVYFCAISAGFVTGLYALFWNGWAFLLILCFCASIILSIIGKLLDLHKESKISFQFSVVYLLSSFSTLSIFLTPRGFLGSIDYGWFYLHKFFAADIDLWPDPFLTVGEAAPISFIKLMALTGSRILWAIGSVGLVMRAVRSFQSKDWKIFYSWMTALIFAVPLMFLSLKTERFSVLFILPFSFFVAYGVEEVCAFLVRVMTSIAWFKNRFLLFRIFSWLLFLLVVIPPVFVYSTIVSTNIKPIMDEAWHQTMKNIESKTPESSIIDSWWPPGYFIMALGKRRTIFDGGSQDKPEGLWVAKALLTSNERQAANILKMINANGDEALAFVRSLGFNLPQAISFISDVTLLDREEAEKKLTSVTTDEQRKKLLDLIYGASSPEPAYVLVYKDLIETNIAIQLVGRWDFQKSYEKSLPLQKSGQSLSRLFPERPKGYVDDVFETTYGVLKYTAVAKLTDRNEDVLNFSNGTSINLATMDCDVYLKNKDFRGKPVSLFYMKGDELKERIFTGERIDSSALLIDENGSYSSVLADRLLIQSMLFRLYYLRAKGLKHFKLFSAEKDPVTQNEVYVFEIN